jgi:hypothetical protein
MTQIERQQRGLLALVKNRTPPCDDAYLQKVADSRELVVLREIALWWRLFPLESQCRFTARLLKRLGCFESFVTTYFNNNATSPFVEELSRDFLRSLQNNRDELIRAVSQFEWALMQVRAGSAKSFEVLWSRHPDLVIRALEEESQLPTHEPGCFYRMRIADDIPGFVECAREFGHWDDFDSVR